MNKVARTGAITPEQLAVLKSGEWFGALDSSFRQAVLTSSRIIVLTAGESVCRRGYQPAGKLLPKKQESIISLLGLGAGRWSRRSDRLQSPLQERPRI